MTAERRPSETEIHPADELELLDRMPPAREESAGVWLEWHGRHVVCWTRLGANDPKRSKNAVYMAEGHWRKMLELVADPDSRGARRGYWDLGPKMTDQTWTTK